MIKSFADILPAPTNRAFFVGQTGMGKSVLARAMLQTRRSVLIADPKNDTRWPGYRRYSSLKKLVSDNPARAIFAPSAQALREDENLWDRFYHYAFKRTKTTVYTDEIYLICNSALDMPHYYRAIQTGGRSLGLEGWSGTQRPSNVPIPLMSEAENYYVFFLSWEEDRKRVRRMTGIAEESIENLPDNEFFYYKKSARFISPRLKLDLLRS